MDSFFPLMDKVDTERRIFQALDALGYSDYELIVDVDVQNHAIMALLCNMLVMGECMDPDGTDAEDSRPGWTIYIRGRKLLQQCSSLKDNDLDLVRYHTLNCLYMMNCELLQSASHAISTAFQVAVNARLNDQSSWGECTPLEMRSRQMLWWTIYFLDRRIAQRNGSPYLIRDTEVAVEEFVPKHKALREDVDDDFSKSDTRDYCQALVNFSKLWGYIWDAFFAARVEKRRDWEEIEIMDTRILFIRKQLPRSLSWNTDTVGTYMVNGENEPQVRRRLALFIVSTIHLTCTLVLMSNRSQRINLIRMLIRQNPLLSSGCNEESKLFCARVAKDSIEAISAFANAYPRIRASGYFISTTLVECVYHLVYILQDQTANVDRASVIASFRAAYQLLVDFGNTWITARRALQALGTAVFNEHDPDSFFETLSERGDESERLEDTPRDNGPISRPSSPYHPSQPEPLRSDMLPVQTPTSTQLSQQILQQEAQHLRYTGDSEFIHDLANSYGEMDFDYPNMIFRGT
jgi:hypothetical protein